MKHHDLWRFLAVLLLGFLLGAVSGHYATSLTITLCLFIFWQYHQYRQVLAWLKKRHQVEGPQQSGTINEICREIDFIKDRHTTREQKLGTFLKRFQKATGALPDAVVVLGLNGEIDWANKKAEDYLGIKWPQDSGLRIANLIRRSELHEFFSTGSHSNKESLQLVSPINQSIQLEVRIRPYGDKQKLLVARDITNIVKANQMRKDFIANASHELRTPLTVISGYLENFVEDDLCPQEWVTYIKQMRSQTARMQNLIEDLLTLSRLEASKEDTADKDTVRVPDMLANIVKEARALSGDLQHQIELQAQPALYLSGNHSQLYSAFSNLVFNAVQYTPEKGKILVRWYSDHSGAHLVVTDDGLGIAAEYIPRLTERFFRIDKGRSREKGGTGLGLAIVKHVLARHGSKLEIESKPGQGSTFRCCFPASRLLQQQTSINNSLSA